MRVRNLVICFLVGIFAVAAATVIVTSNVHGEGRAVNGDGRQAQFNMDVTKRSQGDRSTARGTFRLTSPGGERRSAGIYMPAVDEAVFAENVATFAGNAILRLQEGGTAHEYHGRVHVVATSNRHRDEVGDPDSIRVDFLPAVQTDPEFHFRGNLTAGDIAVTTTRSY